MSTQNKSGDTSLLNTTQSSPTTLASIPNAVLFNKVASAGSSNRSTDESIEENVVDYKNINLLRKYTSENGRILPRRITGLTRKRQNDVRRAVKRARVLALMPYANAIQ